MLNPLTVSSDCLILRSPRSRWFETREAALGAVKGTGVQRAVLIERSTASLGQQSSFSPADF